jgi:hypothetical protein
LSQNIAQSDVCIVCLRKRAGLQEVSKSPATVIGNLMIIMSRLVQHSDEEPLTFHILEREKSSKGINRHGIENAEVMLPQHFVGI